MRLITIFPILILSLFLASCAQQEIQEIELIEDYDGGFRIDSSAERVTIGNQASPNQASPSQASPSQASPNADFFTLDFSRSEALAINNCGKGALSAGNSRNGCVGGLAQAQAVVQGQVGYYQSLNACQERAEQIMMQRLGMMQGVQAWCDSSYSSAYDRAGCREAASIFFSGFSGGRMCAQQGASALSDSLNTSPNTARISRSAPKRVDTQVKQDSPKYRSTPAKTNAKPAIKAEKPVVKSSTEAEPTKAGVNSTREVAQPVAQPAVQPVAQPVAQPVVSNQVNPSTENQPAKFDDLYEQPAKMGSPAESSDGGATDSTPNQAEVTNPLRDEQSTNNPLMPAYQSRQVWPSESILDIHAE